MILDCKLAYYVAILLRLGEAVCRQRPELWVRVCYMKLCVGQRHELWVRVGYMKLCVGQTHEIWVTVYKWSCV